ncbi:MAG: hypothetical protein JF600_12330 [Xanthomonadales bacterium]|nr:hypothetical protein [Xanthomonadales bacterium]
MARFPKIDTPCPLSAEEQAVIEGHCGHCDKHVHRLDALDEAQRHALLANADGPICVTYRMPKPAPKSHPFSAAIAITLLGAGGAAYAGEPPQDPPPEGLPWVAHPADAAMSPLPDENKAALLDFVVFLGGVDDPRNATDVEDAEAKPMLPMLTPEDALTQTPVEEPLDTVVVLGGGMSRPGEAEGIATGIDDVAADLPMIAPASPDQGEGGR